MCGIVGFVDKRSKEEKAPILDKMMDRIRHRGPNSEGKFIGDNAAIGFRRLSIIDLQGGGQPIYNETGNLVLTYNGEIYNYKELREDLIAKGHIFKTSVDSEVVVHGYEEYGKDVLKKFRGMYAFIIWDIEKKELFGARDRYGIKPFYYVNDGDVFMYCSEAKGFLDYPDFKKEINKDALRSYMTLGYSALDETFFKGAYKLPPAHCFTWDQDTAEMKIEKYYDIEINPGPSEDVNTAVRDINTIMEDSVKWHSGADVGVGSFLSGGMDSSYITKYLKPEKTFTVAYEGGDQEGIKHAEEYSKILGATNYSKVITPQEFFNLVEKVQYYADDPYADPSAVSVYELAEIAKGNITVSLSGEGADEVFGGYDEYLGGYNSDKPVEEWYTGHNNIFTEAEAEELLVGDYKKGVSPLQVAQKYYEHTEGWDNISKQQYLDIALRLPNDALLKADRMGSAHGIEGRTPFLDKEVLKVAEILPTNCKVHGDKVKYALGLAAKEVVNEEMVHKPADKLVVPFGKWIKEQKWVDVVAAIFDEEFVSQFFDREKILTMLEDHYNGKADYSDKLYTIYAFLVWYKVYFIENYTD